MINPVLKLDAVESYVKQKDYMNVLTEPKIIEQFNLYHEDIQNEELFSDGMYILDGKFKRNRIIFIILYGT